MKAAHPIDAIVTKLLLTENTPCVRLGHGECVIRIRIDHIADSCGFGVPHMELIDQRTRLTEWVDAKTDEELAAYRAEKNRISIDGLPAIDAPVHDAVSGG